jgi:hypothetical protein
MQAPHARKVWRAPKSVWNSLSPPAYGAPPFEGTNNTSRILPAGDKPFVQ